MDYHIIITDGYLEYRIISKINDTNDRIYKIEEWSGDECDARTEESSIVILEHQISEVIRALIAVEKLTNGGKK
tara:strand:+ start:376 stop:597 length:222 start_codon:yes stop_codon:yes gene_type:complete